MPDTRVWFLSLDGGHVRGNSVSNTLCAAFKRAGTNHRARQMRAWHGTTLIEFGADSLDVQHSLRHSDAQSMKAYIRPSQDHIRAAMESLPRVDSHMCDLIATASPCAWPRSSLVASSPRSSADRAGGFYPQGRGFNSLRGDVDLSQQVAGLARLHLLGQGWRQAA